ncbi:hypothetical protein [Marinicrinis sediminis]|uniref:Uncharacterized protein n=1 Tax=Marinicrinis sediminis TaxID=1652465 RepID=A0ABW5RBT4_9BACL
MKQILVSILLILLIVTILQTTLVGENGTENELRDQGERMAEVISQIDP